MARGGQMAGFFFRSCPYRRHTPSVLEEQHKQTADGRQAMEIDDTGVDHLVKRLKAGDDSLTSITLRGHDLEARLDLLQALHGNPHVTQVRLLGFRDEQSKLLTELLASLTHLDTLLVCSLELWASNAFRKLDFLCLGDTLGTIVARCRQLVKLDAKRIIRHEEDVRSFSRHVRNHPSLAHFQIDDFQTYTSRSNAREVVSIDSLLASLATIRSLRHVKIHANGFRTGSMTDEALSLLLSKENALLSLSLHMMDVSTPRLLQSSLALQNNESLEDMEISLIRFIGASFQDWCQGLAMNKSLRTLIVRAHEHDLDCSELHTGLGAVVLGNNHTLQSLCIHTTADCGDMMRQQQPRRREQPPTGLLKAFRKAMAQNTTLTRLRLPSREQSASHSLNLNEDPVLSMYILLNQIGRAEILENPHECLRFLQELDTNASVAFLQLRPCIFNHF